MSEFESGVRRRGSPAGIAGDPRPTTAERPAAAGGRASRRGRESNESGKPRDPGESSGHTEPGGPREPGGGRSSVRPDPVDPLSVAREICLRQLAVAPRTKAQLAAAMARRGVEEDAAEQVLVRLGEVGLVDDAAFAAAWVESRHAGRGLSRRALAHELRRRGVADPLVDGAVAELDPDREMATARELAVRRLAASRGLDPAVRFRRAAGALARRGYSEAVTYRVIREALEYEEGAAGIDEALAGFAAADEAD